MLMAGCATAASTTSIASDGAGATPVTPPPTLPPTSAEPHNPASAVQSSPAAASVPGPSIDVRPVAGTGGPVPWADLAYRPSLTADSAAPPAGSPPWCRPSDVTVTEAAPRREIQSSAVDTIVLTVNARHRCSLQGAATATIHDSADPVVVVGHQPSIWRRLGLAPDSFSVWPVVVADPSHPAYEQLVWNHLQCQGTGRVSVTLPHAAGTLSFDYPPAGTAAPCTSAPPAPSMGDPGGDPDWSNHWLTIHPLTSLTSGREADQPWTALGGVQPLPATVPAGGTLHYQVQLATLPGHPLSLSPCPGFREQLLDSTTGAAIATEDHQLNCSGLTTISHLGTRFDMELSVPRSVPAGTKALLAWQPSDPTISGTDPFTGDPHYQVTVTP